jgi:glycosyltransferase involved in cell wall biosynthesis
MRIAFYAPMKPPDHPVPSGDRTMARLLMSALGRAGHTVDLASRLRSWDGSGDAIRQARLGTLGERLADRFFRRVERDPARRPVLWLTYHLYHKAPDWLGPRVAEALAIPYVVVEASYAAKRDAGAWRAGNVAVADALRLADAVVGLNPADRPGVLPLLASRQRWIDLPPFVTVAPWAEARGNRPRHRQALASRFDLDPGVPWLVAVAMMRAGDKLRSYRALAAALARLGDLPWRLLVVGDGPAHDAVMYSFAPIAHRIAWLGEVAPAALAPVLAAADVFVWPAINEAFGLALLEAQAAGLPAVAGRAGGIPEIVADGVTGRLVAPDDPVAFAAALAPLLRDPALRQRCGTAAAERTARVHDIGAAARELDALITRLVAEVGR